MIRFWRRRPDPLAGASRDGIASTAAAARPAAHPSPARPAAAPEPAAPEHQPPEAPLSTPDRSHHVATVTHEGRFWDVYVEVVPQASPREPVRGRLMFSAADDAQPVHTAPIFVEPSVDQIIERARELGTHRLIALLRSCLP